MPEIVLCEGNPRIAIDGVGDRTLLVIKDGTSVRFWMETDRLTEALAGDALQVSAEDGYLHIEGGGEVVHFEFRLRGESPERCEIPKREVEAAIEVVRTQVLWHVENPRVQVEEA